MKIDFTQKDVGAILEKVRAYDWHEMPEMEAGADPWVYGTDMTWLRELCAYWVKDYDWGKAQTRLNEFTHDTAPIDGIPIHFIHEKTTAPNAKTLLLTHGWPGSIVEFLDVIEPLAHPERFGGAAADGVHIVAPSLPGYAFSGKPPRPIGPKTTARIWDTLMREHLGYETYIAQGGDWGAVVSGYLGLDHAAPKEGGCAGIHLNMYGLRPQDAKAETEDEKAWEASAQGVLEWEGAYLRLQMTKPQTLSYAMMDSPVGVCAWIVEKFNTWADTRGADGAEHIENAFTKDKILTNVMVYLLTRSFNTSTWFYRGAFEEGVFAGIPSGRRVEVPTGIAAFPKEFIAFPPRRMVETGYNVARWTEFNAGGHFAAMERPEVFVEEVRAFLRDVAD